MQYYGNIMQDNIYTNLVFSGGGTKGFAYKGVVSELERHNKLHHIKKVAGSSAGGLTAMLIALGYTAAEIAQIIDKQNIDTILDPYDNLTFGKSNNLMQLKILKNLIRLGNAVNGEKLLQVCQNHVAKKLLNPNATFKDLHDFIINNSESNLKYLYLTASLKSSLGLYQVILSHETTPNMPIALGARASAAFPILFPAIEINQNKLQYYTKNSDKALCWYLDENLISRSMPHRIKLLDGSLTCNVPQYIFQDELDKTLTFNISSSSMKKDFNKRHSRLIFNKIKQIYKNKAKIIVPPASINNAKLNTIYIDTSDIKILDFNLPYNKREEIANLASSAVKNALNNLASIHSFNNFDKKFEINKNINDLSNSLEQYYTILQNINIEDLENLMLKFPEIYNLKQNIELQIKALQKNMKKLDHILFALINKSRVINRIIKTIAPKRYQQFKQIENDISLHKKAHELLCKFNPIKTDTA